MRRRAPTESGDEADGEYELFAATRDVSDRYAAQQQLEQLALRDGLTGLANRALLSDRLTTAIERLERRGGAVAVYLIDLDHFKAINDTFGHAGGDAVIVEAGRRLIRASRAGDTVARLGGDELILVAEVAGTGRGRGARAAGCSTSCASPTRPGRHGLHGIGRACAGPRLPLRSRRFAPAGRRRAVCREAGRARPGRGLRRCSAAPAGSPPRGRAAGTHRARRRSACGCNYQPLADLETGAVVGAEALARLDSPDGLPVSPDIFIGVAEETGLIAELDRWVISARHQARSASCRQSVARSGLRSSRSTSRRAPWRRRISHRGWPRTLDGGASWTARGLSLELTERTLLVAGETVERTLAALAEWVSASDGSERPRAAGMESQDACRRVRQGRQEGPSVGRSRPRGPRPRRPSVLPAGRPGRLNRRHSRPGQEGDRRRLRRPDDSLPLRPHVDRQVLPEDAGVQPAAPGRRGRIGVQSLFSVSPGRGRAVRDRAKSREGRPHSGSAA